jgi:hypothetical protein
MSTTLIRVFNPTARSGEQASVIASAAPRLEGLAGKIVGFIDNSKPNFRLLAEDMAGILMSRYGVKSTFIHNKPAASIPAPLEILDRYGRDCDLVVTGSGD